MGKVLSLGGVERLAQTLADVRLVDLATGTCTTQPNHMLHGPRYKFAAGQLKDGRIVCAGGEGFASGTSAEVYGPPALGAPDAPWTWTELHPMSVQRHGCCGCVISDGRFVVLGGLSTFGVTTLCESLQVFDAHAAAHWDYMAPMHETR